VRALVQLTGFGWGEADETGRAEARAFVRRHFAEPIPGFPVGASLRDLLLRAGDEVPPHENALGERRSSDEQQSASFAAREVCFRACPSKVVQDALFKRLITEHRVTAEHEQRVLEVWLKRQHQRPACVHFDVRSHGLREVNGR